MYGKREEKPIMKKNIWSNVYYRLNDPVMIRLAVLYVLKYADIPISSMDLKHVMLDSTSVDYIDLCETIEDLKNEDYIRIVMRDEMNKFVLSELGNDTIEMFEKNLLISVRQAIKKSADEFFKDEFEKSQVKCELSPSDADTYYLDVELQDGRTKLLSMSIFAGDRESAAKMRERFNESPMELFEEIQKFLRKK